ncbi:hypothetical protein IFM89_035266 [Coptis chinensis]|uniref:DNA repair protein RAD16 n=1 Tax=Coptis chinensis TaxID=261450 RepID=A0A835GZG0_9MAGN|nr:hypothetical protein IFM89_035266 [Coptis chinensis]
MRRRSRRGKTHGKKRMPIDSSDDDDDFNLLLPSFITPEDNSGVGIMRVDENGVVHNKSGVEKGKGVIYVGSEMSSDESNDVSLNWSSDDSSDVCVEYGNGKRKKINVGNNNKKENVKVDVNVNVTVQVPGVGPTGMGIRPFGLHSGEMYEKVEGWRGRMYEKPEGWKAPPKKRGRKGEIRPPLMWENLEDEYSEWINEHEMENTDWDFAREEVTEAVEASKDLTLPLLRYQKEWLAWAMKQEESISKGGILADEMGMGKTIQAIALVLAKRVISKGGGGFNGGMPLFGSGEQSTIKATLVICPVVAVLQWVNEIAQHTVEGSTKVLVYHGANRKKSAVQFSDYDFVITTYSIVEAEYRKNVMPPKEKCVWCGKLFVPKKMNTHLRYFCGPDAVKTDKQSKQARKKENHGLKPSECKTKFASAAVENDNFEGSDEEEGNSKHTWKKVKPAKKGRKKSGGVVEEFETEEIGDKSRLKNSILHSLRWNRIILDEAHYIKDRRSSTARAVLALESSYKWALSGTPLQNRVGELYSLVRFLQITPYSYYFCRDCDCKNLDYRYFRGFFAQFLAFSSDGEMHGSSTSQCPNCPHKSVRHFCWWNKFIATPIQVSSSSYDGKRAMILLKHKLLKSIVLRRTKKGRASDLALPPRIVTMRRDTLDVKEEDYYESLYSDSQYIEAGTLMNNYAHIFDLLTRLRQAVDHPYLVIYSNSAGSRSQNNTYISEQECGICHDPAEDPVVTSCEHVFCKACLTDYAAALGQVSCPSCSKPLTADFTAKVNPGDMRTKTTIKGYRCSSILNRISLPEFQTSTKIDALREEIRFMVERDGAAKGIVFSQFTSFLDLINYSLQKSGLQCVQLVGSMTMTARDVAIRRFTEDPECKIFLMSLKAGGVALNLTVASHVSKHSLLYPTR